MKLGIIGLPYVGKTTLFNVLTRGHAQTGTHSRSPGQLPNVGIVVVPDRRLDALGELFKRRKIIHATIEYLDTAGLARGAAQEAESDGFWQQVRQVDALVHVVRAFRNEAVSHVEGSIDPARDWKTLQTELILADLITVENRLERLQKSLLRGKQREDLRDKELMERCRIVLEGEQPLSILELTAEETRILKGFQFLTRKPQLVIVNIDENHLTDGQPVPPLAELPTAAVCGKIEEELAQLDPAEAAELMPAYGIPESGLVMVIRLSYQSLGLISFFTIGDEEVRAWTIARGTPAVEAAGAVHSDMQRGFIRAEVVHYDDLAACGSQAKAREKGLLRLEGKEYTVKDGDICQFRFHV